MNEMARKEDPKAYENELVKIAQAKRLREEKARERARNEEQERDREDAEKQRTAAE